MWDLILRVDCLVWNEQVYCNEVESIGVGNYDSMTVLTDEQLNEKYQTWLSQSICHVCNTTFQAAARENLPGSKSLKQANIYVPALNINGGARKRLKILPP